jgi:hypothetical protein
MKLRSGVVFTRSSETNKTSSSIMDAHSSILDAPSCIMDATTKKPSVNVTASLNDDMSVTVNSAVRPPLLPGLVGDRDTDSQTSHSSSSGRASGSVAISEFLNSIEYQSPDC